MTPWFTGRARTIVALGAALLLTACDAPTYSRPEPAYSPTSLVAGLAYRWPSGSTVRVWLEPASVPGRDYAAALDRAISEWNAIPQFGEVQLARASSREAANALLYDIGTPQPVRIPDGCPFNAGSGVGYTWFCVNQGAENAPLDARARPVLLTNGTLTRITVVVRVDAARLPTQTALDAVVAHELGHALGIGGHSPDNADLMAPFPQVASPSARDAATLRFVLGQRPVFFLGA